TWLALAVLMGAPAGESMTATLVEGPVTVAGAPLVTGAVLQPGDTVEAQAGGRAEIALPGGSLLRIGENTRLTLSPVPTRSEFSARLFFGNLWARVHKLAAGETFRVETENGVAGVGGIGEYGRSLEGARADVGLVPRSAHQPARGGCASRLRRRSADDVRQRCGCGRPARGRPAEGRGPACAGGRIRAPARRKDGAARPVGEGASG